MVDGKVHQFSAGGLYNGLVLLVDDETNTYWDHMTGEALYGPLVGRILSRWGLQYTTVGAAVENDPALQVLRPRPVSLVAFLMRWLHRSAIGKKGFLPPGFRKTMAEVDPRLPEMEQGLGVIIDGQARFYATRNIGEGITDDWDGKILKVEVGVVDRVPFAVWGDGERPLQIFARWYGFSFNYPGCSVVVGRIKPGLE